MKTAPEIKDLIVDDRETGVYRYHRSALTSPQILESERERIFNKCWLYLGHESEVTNPGEYRRRNVAGRPLVFIRGQDRRVRVFLNTCRHRGALICRQDEGKAETFQCFYHAWTYNNLGELIGVPDDAAYSDSLDKGELGLISPPRVEIYRGLIFVSFNPSVSDLTTYLSGAKEYIDLVMDQSEVGMRVIRGANKYEIRANWKLLVENSIDQYHAFPTHKTFFDYMASLWPEMPRSSEGVGRALGNGHAVMEYPATAGRPIALWTPLFKDVSPEQMADKQKRLEQQFGKERAHRMCANNRNLVIYPNLVLNDVMALTLRYFEPATPNRMSVTAWHLVPSDESEALLATRLDSFLSFLGPGGLATPDDVEALESCQAGFQASEVEWSDISRGMHREAQAVDELQMRGFWRQWHGDMLGLDHINVEDKAAVTTDAVAGVTNKPG